MESKDMAMFEIFKSRDAKFVWHLRADNGEILCHSETYTTRRAAEDGIAVVKRVAPVAPVYDRTQADVRRYI